MRDEISVYRGIVPLEVSKVLTLSVEAPSKAFAGEQDWRTWCKTLRLTALRAWTERICNRNAALRLYYTDKEIGYKEAKKTLSRAIEVSHVMYTYIRSLPWPRLFYNIWEGVMRKDDCEGTEGFHNRKSIDTRRHRRLSISVSHVKSFNSSNRTIIALRVRRWGTDNLGNFIYNNEFINQLRSTPIVLQALVLAQILKAGSSIRNLGGRRRQKSAPSSVWCSPEDAAFRVRVRW